MTASDEWDWLDDDLRADLAAILHRAGPWWLSTLGMSTLGVIWQEAELRRDLIGDREPNFTGLLAPLEQHRLRQEALEQEALERAELARAAERHIVAELSELARRIEAVPVRLFEVGWLAHGRLRLLAASGDGPVAGRFGEWPRPELTGIPIVERNDLAPDAWRLLEDGDTVREGTL